MSLCYHRHSDCIPGIVPIVYEGISQPSCLRISQAFAILLSCDYISMATFPISFNGFHFKYKWLFGYLMQTGCVRLCVYAYTQVPLPLSSASLFGEATLHHIFVVEKSPLIMVFTISFFVSACACVHVCV